MDNLNPKEKVILRFVEPAFNYFEAKGISGFFVGVVWLGIWAYFAVLRGYKRGDKLNFAQWILIGTFILTLVVATVLQVAMWRGYRTH